MTDVTESPDAYDMDVAPLDDSRKQVSEQHGFMTLLEPQEDDEDSTQADRIVSEEEEQSVHRLRTYSMITIYYQICI